MFGKNVTFGNVNIIGVRDNKYSNCVGLIKYYKKFGFKEFNATDGENPNLYLEPLDIFKNLADSDGKTNEGNLTLMALNCPFDLSGLSFPYTMP